MRKSQALFFMLAPLFALSTVALSPVARTAPGRTPWWVRAVPVGDETQLKQAVGFMLPPRRAVCPDKEFGRTDGRCLPASLILQLKDVDKKRLEDVRVASPLRSKDPVDNFMLRVVDFAEKHQDVDWDTTTPGAETLGNIMAYVGRLRGWDPLRIGSRPAAASWLANMRFRPHEGADAAFLFAAAACFQLRIHVYSAMESGRGVRRVCFEAPPTAPRRFRPKLDVHVGYVAVGNGECHYVSLPVSPERIVQASSAALLVASAAFSHAVEGVSALGPAGHTSSMLSQITWYF